MSQETYSGKRFKSEFAFCRADAVIAAKVACGNTDLVLERKLPQLLLLP